MSPMEPTAETSRQNLGQNKIYEVAYLISPILSLEEAQNVQQTVKNMAQELGSLIEEEGGLFKRRLSFEIKKVREAYLAHFKFALNPEKIAEFRTKIEAEQKVLRSLIVETKRTPPKNLRTRTIKAETPLSDVEPETETKAEKQTETSNADMAEIDKKLEEILGK